MAKWGSAAPGAAQRPSTPCDQLAACALVGLLWRGVPHVHERLAHRRQVGCLARADAARPKRTLAARVARMDARPLWDSSGILAPLAVPEVVGFLAGEVLRQPTPLLDHCDRCGEKERVPDARRVEAE